MENSPRIRPATVADLPAINGIYNHYVETCTCTWRTTPLTEAERLAWFQTNRTEAHPVTVAELDGQVAGWGALSPFRGGEGFRFTAENSVYVHPGFHRRGIGRALLLDLVERARRAGLHVIVAGISADQTASLGLHAAAGFVKVAHMPETGFKFGRRLDLVFLQLTL